MDLGDILRVIRKRWYIMLPMVLVTLALTATAYLQVPIKYQSTSQVSLLSPQQQASGTFRGQSNPFLIFDTSLTSTADLLARSLTSNASVKELATRGVTEDYTAKLADFAQGPFLALTVTGTNKAHVLASTVTLTSFARERLQLLQQQNGVPGNNLIQTTVIIPPQPPQSQLKSKLQTVLALLAGGLVAAFMATFMTEGMSRSRDRRLPAAARPSDVRTAQVTAAMDSEQTKVLKRPRNLSMPLAGTPAQRDSPVLEKIAPRHAPEQRDKPSSRESTADAPIELIRSSHKEQGPTNGNGKPAGSPVLYRSASASARGEDAGAHAKD